MVIKQDRIFQDIEELDNDIVDQEQDQGEEQNDDQEGDEFQIEDDNNLEGDEEGDMGMQLGMQKINKRDNLNDAINHFKSEFQHSKKDVSHLVKDQVFNTHMEKLEKYITNNEEQKQFIGVQDEQYHIIIQSNEYTAIIEREIAAVHQFVKDLYSTKFSELQEIVNQPLSYVKCVKLIQNELDISKIDFSSLLDNRQIIAITVAFSSSNGKYLTNQNMQKCLEACDVIINLNEAGRKILVYVEQRMKYIAPNLSKLVGPTCASKLISSAGGLDNLAKMPACNIQVMGSQQKALLGFSKAGAEMNRGYFGNLEMVKKAPVHFRIQLVRMLSTNVAKCARIDNLKTCNSGAVGEQIREEMLERFDKIQEAFQPKMKKALPAPDDKPRKQRGGKQFQKMRDRIAVTEVKQYQNRIQFGQKEDQFRDTGQGFGMLGVGTGKVKLQIKKDKQVTFSKQMQNRLNFHGKSGQGATGLTSTLAFTPVQGIELINPDLIAARNEQKQENYFSKLSGFKSVMENRKNKVGFSNLINNPQLNE